MPISLPTFSSSYSGRTRTSKDASRILRRTTKAIMKSHHMKLPKFVGDLPLRFRPAFVVFTALVMISLAFLGFTNFAHALPINDKALHFVCFLLATVVFYFVFDVEEDARRVWFWRTSPLIITGGTCVFVGGVLSEFVQSMLPYKTFQIGDVVANMLGSSLGLWGAYFMERYYRHRREISRLYRPLDVEAPSDYDSDSEEGAEQLLPTLATPPGKPKGTMGNVWDEREDLFDIGADSDDDDGRSPRP